MSRVSGSAAASNRSCLWNVNGHQSSHVDSGGWNWWTGQVPVRIPSACLACQLQEDILGMFPCEDLM